jgi:hypothetical protein
MYLRFEVIHKADFRLYGGWFLWAVFVANYRSNKNFWANFLRDKSYALLLTKNGFGYILGDFITS